MKIEFEDKSYIQVDKNNDKVIIIISAKDYENPLKKITNTVELTIEEFERLIKNE